ncbi:hypothetical protein IW261DRAFT_860055 [Armillaria novae-zelandiae]|uniref:DUF6534 domain-containing protein n=1 Tax=Armillaria novae-zelandiae TaxID=153914 RepID=A0AA39UD44_9AGAR|nr:hypothetical protein IW261DRAFT_860055 [Armillaria novae-zelandiae]
MQPVPTSHPIAELSGPVVVGCLLNCGLFGTLSVQLYLYYLAFPNDRRFTKCLVYGIYVVEFVQTLLIAHDVFAIFGYGFGEIGALTRMNSFWIAVPIVSSVAAGVGQVFYAYRIFVLSKSQIIPIFIICISLTSSVAAIITGIYSFQAADLTKMNNRETTISIGIWCGASALCDIIIAICMTYYLMHSTTNFRRTRMLVTKIIRLTIETGSVTAVVALLNFILLIAFPHQTPYVIPGLLLPKLYANSVYMVLNSRFKIIGGRDTYESSMDTMSVTTTMMRDIISQSTDDTQPADRTQGQVPAVILSSDVFPDIPRTGQINDKPRDGRMTVSA